jgi:hypothetical protein
MSLAMALATACLAGGDDIRLIEALRAERGIPDGPTTGGQLALARWMLGEMGGEFRRSYLLAGVSDDLIIRFLTGEAEPNFEMAQHIANKTKGAVMPLAWSRSSRMPERADEATARLGGAAARKPLPSRPPHVSALAPEVGSLVGYGAMLVQGDLIIFGSDSAIRVPAAEFRTLYNQMTPLLSTIEHGAPG